MKCGLKRIQFIALPNQSAQAQSLATTLCRISRHSRKALQGRSVLPQSHFEERSVIASNQPSLRGTANRHCEEQQTVIARLCKPSLRVTAKRHCEELQTVIASSKPSLRGTKQSRLQPHNSYLLIAAIDFEFQRYIYIAFQVIIRNGEKGQVMFLFGTTIKNKFS